MNKKARSVLHGRPSCVYAVMHKRPHLGLCDVYRCIRIRRCGARTGDRHVSDAHLIIQMTKRLH